MLDLSQVAGIRLADPAAPDGPVGPTGTVAVPPAPPSCPPVHVLPAHPGSGRRGMEPERAEAAEAEAPSPGPAVLIVDDNVRLARTIAAFMEMQGFRAHPAHSAEEALVAAHQVGFDLVILDINMPGMDGLEVCRRLLATAPEMRVLMVTGRDSEEDPLRAAAVGACGLLTKPISLATLRDEMLRVLAG